MIDKRVSTQLAIESVYSRSHIRKWIRQRIEQDKEFVLLDWYLKAGLRLYAWMHQEFSYASKTLRVERLRESGMSPEELATEVAVSVLHKTGDKSYQEVAGHLSEKMPHEDVFDRVKTAAELVALCEGLGLYHIKRGSPPLIVTNYVLNTEVYAWIQETLPALPMLCEPVEVINNDNCGYLETKTGVLMGQHTDHGMPVALDVINILNQQAWELDAGVLTEAECAKEELTDAERWENHRRMAKDSAHMYDLVLEHGNECWFTHQYDSRGRLYTRGYHINLQSSEFKKALLNFKEKEVIQ